MKITNNHNIPTPLYKAICKDEYDRGDSDVTVTTLIKPVQIQILEKQHWKDIEIDVLDNLCMFLGHSLHKALEECSDDAIIEQRFYKTFNLGGNTGSVKLGGCVDYYDPFTETIVDYKLTNVFSVKEGCKDDWEKQLNCYAHLIRANGLPVKKLQICAIIKDWSRSQAMNNADYPAHPVMVIDVPVWQDEEAEAYIVLKLNSYICGIRQNVYQCCSDEDMWQQPDTYKVFKGDNSRATKCFGTREEAQLYIEGVSKDKDKYRTVCYQGRRTRCENFCRVNRWCPQYRQYLDDHTDVS